jgi:hypothetical protein
MREECPQIFPDPQQNKIDQLFAYIKWKLEKAGINPREIAIDGSVTTDKKVPQEIMANIRQNAASYGLTIKFLTSG